VSAATSIVLAVLTASRHHQELRDASLDVAIVARVFPALAYQ